MKVVNISLSPSVLDSGSATFERISNYGRVTDEFIILVPNEEDREVRLSKNVIAYGITGSNKLIKLFRVYKKVKALIAEGRCDVIATDQYFFGLMGVYVSKRFGVGFESIALGFEKFTWFRKRIAKFVFNHAGSVRVNSPRLVRFVASELGISGEKVHMVPIYVDVKKMGLSGERTDDEQREYEKHMHEFTQKYGEKFNFLSVNRLVPAKNISLQLRAIAQLVKENKQIHLHVLGDGPDEPTLVEEIKKLKIEQNVSLHGHTSGLQLGSFYESSDCFLLTSDNEGWGMVIVEALTAKLPVIMTDVGSAGELIIDGKSGMVIPINDENALVSAMKRIIQDNEERNRFIEGGQKSLQSLLSFEELLQLYRESWEYTLKN